MLEVVSEYFTETPPLLLVSVWTLIAFGLWRFIRLNFNFNFQGEIPKLHCRPSKLSDYLVKNCKALTEPYVPPFYARNKHIQTILPVFLRETKYTFSREYVKMEDGGQVALDWGVTGANNLKADSTILIVLPGLTGTNSGFKSLCKRASEQGLRTVFFNKRGHGNSVLTTPKFQSFGDSSDLRTCVLHIEERYPQAKKTAIGHSAGSGLLACYLGTYKEESLISAACCVSPGYDLAKIFQKPLPWFYEYVLLKGLKDLVRQHAEVMRHAVDVDHVLQSKTITAFDHRFYCKLYGIEDVHTYWNINNPLTRMKDITVPVLCLNSLSDPLFGEWLIPWDLFQSNGNGFLVTCQGGGHCGFIHGIHGEKWDDTLCLDFLQTTLRFQSTTAV